MAHRATYFTNTSYTFNPEKKEILFNYEICFEGREPLTFTEKIILPQVPDVSGIPPAFLEALLDDIHIILGISYYKLYCPPEIKMSRKLSKEQADFWITVYRKGLGEFAYRNNLDLRDRIKFPFTNDVPPLVPVEFKRKDRALVGIGGGKDSIVAVELLKEQKYSCTGFIVETGNSHSIPDDICSVAKIPSLKIQRILDEKIFKPLPESFAGHIPISAICAFLGALAAVLYDYRYVVVGNEHSSNFGNIQHHGEEINHQWSKSVEFEKLFTEHLATRTPSIRYFSLLRPFYEIRIAEMFARYPRYFKHFTSCNRKFVADLAKRPKGIWCGECPKCAFVFLILAPFIPREKLIALFGENMLNEKTLEPLFTDILGFGTMKPFDCVGTFDEAQAALCLIRDTFSDSPIVQKFLSKIKRPDAFIKKVMRTQQALTVPTRFRFCGMKSALILGHGKEGRVSKTYLRHTYPFLEIGIADETLGADYLDAQNAYDIVVKTPGIPKSKIHAHYTTATNIFFSQFPDTVIGVTGSKGKSTTASLIHAILLDAGLSARLAGNIGTPMLELLMEGADEKTIAVLELSSYQLDDIEYSPHIAVVTNLFPDHMDYHGGAEKYYQAKKNIMRYQEKDDAFVYNPNLPTLKSWAMECQGQTLAFRELPFDEGAVPLLGEHNIDNVRAAVTAAQLFNIAPEVIERAVRNFKGLPHRLEFVGEFKGIRFYDDAISTTPESTIAALRSIPNIGTIFLGGFDRGYDFTELEKEIRARGITNIVLFPETGKRMFVDRSGLNVLETSDMREAVTFAYKNTAKNSAALLSCASPSYGLWKNFEEKGDQFQKIVRMTGGVA